LLSQREHDGAMPTSLVIVSDTHVPARARRLPPALWSAVEAADLVIHAGDWVDVALLDELEARSARLIGVVGNNDGADLRARLPEVATATVEGIRLVVVHETGQATGREVRMDAAFPDTDVLVFGHSHIPWDSVSPAGMRLLNPGSPTDRRRQPAGTFMAAVADAGRIRELRLVTVDPARRV
jgi:putative phosphoesterase